MKHRRMRAPLAFVASLTLALCLAIGGCASSQATTPDTARTLARPQFGFSLTIPAGWAIQQEQEDPTANTPYTLTIGQRHPAVGASPSQFTLTVIKTTTPDITQLIASYASDPTYQATTIGGQHAYVQTPKIAYDVPPTLVPGQTELPAATPLPDTPGTVSHDDYEIPTSTYLYTIDTDAVAGQDAAAALTSIIQSMSIHG